ncbi:MAG TPA: response regulator [Candidatus Aquirickettsiella sp.]|jgi:CheY-like chemotaxis protein
MTKLQARFKDSITHPHKNSVVLMTAISCGNQGQTGDNWDHFCDLVEHYYKEESIEKLIVVTTGGLQRHYMSLGSRSLSAQEIEQKIHEFDWVLLDISLPDIKGTEVVKRYRQWEKKNSKPRLPIFALTPHQTKEIRKKYFKADIDYVLNKPFTKDDIKIIKLFLENKNHCKNSDFKLLN